MYELGMWTRVWEVCEGTARLWEQLPFSSAARMPGERTINPVRSSAWLVRLLVSQDTDPNKQDMVRLRRAWP
jgi:hypothetical protein